MRVWSMLRSAPTTPRSDLSCGTWYFVSESSGEILAPEMSSLLPLSSR